MKKYWFILAIIVAACNNEQSSTKESLKVATEMTTSKTDTLCFIRVSGMHQEDTAAVKLIITNNEVTGKMMYLPSEKDWRLGNLKGIRKGDELQLTWIYMQEGMKDSGKVSFKLGKEQLLQKPESYDKTGKAFIADTAQYRISYTPVDCGSFPKYDFDLGINS